MQDNEREVLVDKSSSGRVRPWKKLKLKAIQLSDIYKSLYDEELEKTLYSVDPEYWSKRAERTFQCCDMLMFDEYQDGQKKLTGSSSCRVRLCPLCSWRRSLKIQVNARKVFEYVMNQGEYQYAFLTLTVPNCKAEELAETLTEMFSAWNRFMGYKKIKSAVLGWYRALEVTHNVNPDSKSYDTYHPHFHCILVLPKKYYKKYYIPRDEWLALWRKAMRDDSITQVDIRKVKPKDNGFVSAICEAAKYTVKSNDYILPENWHLSMNAVRTLDLALAKRRLVAYGGFLKEIHRDLNLDDEVDGDLVHIDEDAIYKEGVKKQIVAIWSVGYQEYYIW